ncbi:glycosyltransferase [Rubripirellula amarantea]|nr:glycosyltransferase [Rubripirellula amarantea]
MRILIAHNSHKIAGGEQRVFESETAQLEKAGHEVIRFNPHNDEVDGLNGLTLASKTIWNRSSARDLSKLVQTHRPDVAHFHNIVPLISPSVFSVAAKHSVPIVWTLHNYRLICPGMLLLRDSKPCELCVSRSVKTPAVIHKCYRNSRTATSAVTTMLTVHQMIGTWDHIACFVAPSNFAKEKFVQGGLPRDRIVTKSNFVPGNPQTGSGDGNFFLYVGRLSEEKGVNSLLETWQKHRIQERLIIAGEGPLETDVRHACDNNANIEFVGRQSSAEVQRLMSAATATIVPSVCYETFGLVAAESFAVGTPVLASNLGALAELIRPGENGFTFQPGNPDSLAAAIDQIKTSNPDELRMNARQSYEDKYTEERSLAGLLEIYQRVRGIESSSSTFGPTVASV